MAENAVLIFQCGFCKKNIEKSKGKALEKGRTFGRLLTDLSKAFNYTSHDLCIAKIHVLNFDMNTFYFIFDYLKGRNKESKLIPF